eukprot:TRINITY_DN1526_c2_g1_i1.p1 TRINITY_DN1526_c2_g1~~TRINITY_DN1526_c2_g1_i1.p1  ORF type:complete len:282 (+),score=19.29 TRINITY_DN1526_c2_g1_i1:41-847(+)
MWTAVVILMAYATGEGKPLKAVCVDNGSLIGACREGLVCGHDDDNPTENVNTCKAVSTKNPIGCVTPEAGALQVGVTYNNCKCLKNNRTQHIPTSTAPHRLLKPQSVCRVTNRTYGVCQHECAAPYHGAWYHVCHPVALPFQPPCNDGNTIRMPGDSYRKDCKACVCWKGVERCVRSPVPCYTEAYNCDMGHGLSVIPWTDRHLEWCCNQQRYGLNKPGEGSAGWFPSSTLFTVIFFTTFAAGLIIVLTLVVLAARTETPLPLISTRV